MPTSRPTPFTQWCKRKCKSKMKTFYRLNYFPFLNRFILTYTHVHMQRQNLFFMHDQLNWYCGDILYLKAYLQIWYVPVQPKTNNVNNVDISRDFFRYDIYIYIYIYIYITVDYVSFNTQKNYIIGEEGKKLSSILSLLPFPIWPCDTLQNSIPHTQW